MSMKREKKMLEDYAPKVMTLEQYVYYYTYDIDRIGEDTTENLSKEEEKFREGIFKNRLNEMTHEDFHIWVEMMKQRARTEMESFGSMEFLETLKKLEMMYSELLAGKENSKSYQYQYNKLKNKIIAGEKYRRFTSCLEGINIIPSDDVIKDMLLCGDVVLVKDCMDKERFYSNPRRSIADRYYINLLGENIFDTVVSYTDFEVIDYQLEQRDNLRSKQKRKQRRMK